MSAHVVRDAHHGDLVEAPGAGGSATFAVEFSTPFDYLFDKLAADFPHRHLSSDGATVVPQLTALGRAMLENEPPQGGELQATGNSTIPPVYTYWGQFIDHDITLNTDNNNSVSDITAPDLAPLTPAFVASHLRNGRQPALNLDSVYGDGPTFPGGPTTEAASMYDGLALKLSTVLRVPDSVSDLVPPVNDGPGDLFRDNTLTDDPATPNVEPTVAVVGDSRNDENLIVAQLHVAFVKFHNAVLAAVSARPDAPTDPQELFAQVRQLVTWHYQWLVVNDYLRTVTATGVVDKVLLGADPLFAPRNGEPYMPLEFSSAAFRFGHSMVRGSYDYNRNFGRKDGGPGRNLPFAAFELLFAFTGSAHGPDGAPRPFNGTSTTTLPSNWVIEWSRFVDKGSSTPDHFARRIDTQLAPPLFDMLNQVSGGEASFPIALRELLTRLAVRNLLRGYSLALPTGQAVADELGITPLTPAQLRSGNTASVNDVLTAGAFDSATPLWYYVLKEAEVLANGNSLGPVGSRIVAETLVGQLRADAGSFLNAPAGWTPAQGVLLPDGSPIVSIDDLFRFAGAV